MHKRKINLENITRDLAEFELDLLSFILAYAVKSNKIAERRNKIMNKSITGNIFFKKKVTDK